MTKQFFAITAVLILMASLYACSSDQIERLQTDIQNDVERGTWRITKFIDSGVDELSDFAGYSFTFNEDGSVTATLDNNTHTGTWSVTRDISDDSDDDLNDLDFNLSFTAPEFFQELTDDWDIISQSNTRIELLDVSGGNGDVDYLTFEKE